MEILEIYKWLRINLDNVFPYSHSNDRKNKTAHKYIYRDDTFIWENKKFDCLTMIYVSLCLSPRCHIPGPNLVEHLRINWAFKQVKNAIENRIAYMLNTTLLNWRLDIPNKHSSQSRTIFACSSGNWLYYAEWCGTENSLWACVVLHRKCHTCNPTVSLSGLLKKRGSVKKSPHRQM